MAIVACGECGGKVATTATSCPHCGNPIERDPLEELAAARTGPGSRATLSYRSAPVARTPRRGEKVQTIEQTSKRWKVQQVIGVAIVIVGGVMWIAGMMTTRPGQKTVPELSIGGLWILVAGVAWSCWASMMAWWHHG